MLFRLLNILRFPWIGKLMMYLAGQSAQNRTPFQKLSRFIVTRVFAVPKHDDFMADDFVDNDQGFDLQELRQFQSKK